MIARSSLTVLVTVVALLFCPALFGAEIDSRVTKIGGGMDRSIQLVLSADDTPDAEPDFSSLMRDFSILHRNRNQSTKTINGQTSRTVRWTLQLLPKRAGIERIPAIQFGRDRSPAVSLTEIALAKGYPLARKAPLAMPSGSAPPRAIRFEARPPNTTPPPVQGHAKTQDADALGLTDLVLLGGLGGLFAVMIRRYRNHRRGSIMLEGEEIPSPPEPMTEAGKVKQAPASPSGQPELAGVRLQNQPSQPVTRKPIKPSPAPVSTDLLETVVATRKHLSPPEPVIRLGGTERSATPFPNDREIAQAPALNHPAATEQPAKTEGTRLHQACISTDPELAGAVLLEWARERWPDAPPHTLGSLASQFAGTDVEREIRRLDKVLYSPVKKEWHGVTLWQVMKGFMVEQEVAPKKRHLFASFHTG